MNYHRKMINGFRNEPRNPKGKLLKVAIIAKYRTNFHELCNQLQDNEVGLMISDPRYLNGREFSGYLKTDCSRFIKNYQDLIRLTKRRIR